MASSLPFKRIEETPPTSSFYWPSRDLLGFWKVREECLPSGMAITIHYLFSLKKFYGKCGFGEGKNAVDNYN
jgi:hypothetical protein